MFFDGPGGTQVTESVIHAIGEYYKHSNSNTHGPFETSHRTDETIAAARSAMADFLGCDAGEIVFGPNMTTLTFAFSRAIGRDLGPGDEIIVTTLDHDANVAPWRALAEKGCIVHQVDVHTDDCTLDLEDLKQKLSPRTKIVAVGYASNAVGTINPVAEIVKLAHGVGALVFVDGVHYAPHGPIDVKVLDCDFLACSVYKFFGPHIGVVYGKKQHLDRLSPYKVRPSSNNSPERWETGTQNHECLAGVVAAVDYFAELGLRVNPNLNTRREAILAAWDAIRDYEHELTERLIGGVQKIPGITLYGIRDLSRLNERTPTIAVRAEGRTPLELAKALGEAGIFTWEGNYYAINLTERLGLEDKGGMLRIGLVHYNTVEELDRMLAVLGKVVAS